MPGEISVRQEGAVSSSASIKNAELFPVDLSPTGQLDHLQARVDTINDAALRREATEYLSRVADEMTKVREQIELLWFKNAVVAGAMLGGATGVVMAESSVANWFVVVTMSAAVGALIGGLIAGVPITSAGFTDAAARGVLNSAQANIDRISGGN